MNQTIQKKRRYFPSSFLVIIGIMLLFIVISWIWQAFNASIHGIGLLDFSSAIWRGFSSKVDIILFIFSIGGTLGIMTKLKVIDAGIDALVKKLGNSTWILIPILMIIFGLGGTSYGMWEETIAFIPVLIPVFKKAKYGTFTAMLVILIGAGTGCLASTINPFSVGAAVDSINKTDAIVAASKSIQTGTLQGTRWLSFAIFEVISIAVVMWLASRYKKAIELNLTSSKEAKGNIFTKPIVVTGLDHDAIAKRFSKDEKYEFTLKRKISLMLFILGFILMIIMYLPWGSWLNLPTSGMKSYDSSMWWFASTSSAGYASLGEWYFISVAAVFLILTIIIFFINFKDFKSEDKFAEENFIKSYISGISDVLTVCLIIAVAGGLSQVLDATGIGSVIAQAAASGLDNMIVFGVVIFIISIFLSLLVPSTSGFAASFMGIFAQTALIAFPNQFETAAAIAMLGFLFANGLANFVTPTSAALMGYTSYAGIPYNVWLKHVWKIVLILFVVSFALIILFSALAANGSALF